MKDKLKMINNIKCIIYTYCTLFRLYEWNSCEITLSDQLDQLLVIIYENIYSDLFQSVLQRRWFAM